MARPKPPVLVRCTKVGREGDLFTVELQTVPKETLRFYFSSMAMVSFTQDLTECVKRAVEQRAETKPNRALEAV